MTTRAMAARRRARDRMTAELAAAKANEDDLTKYFETDAVIEGAEVSRDAAIEKAHRDYDTATTSARSDQAALLRQMKDRGLTDRKLSDMTGLTLAEVRKLTKATEKKTRPASTKTSDVETKTTVGAGDTIGDDDAATDAKVAS